MHRRRRLQYKQRHAHRTSDAKKQRNHNRTAYAKRIGQKSGELQTARLDFQPSALLGRTDSARALPRMRLRSLGRKRPSARAAGSTVVSADRHRRKSPRPRKRMGTLRVPPLRRKSKARNEYDAAVGRFVLVLSSLFGSAQYKRVCRKGQNRILDARRLICRRRRTRGFALAVCALLAQSAVRFGLGKHDRTVPAPYQSGNDNVLRVSAEKQNPRPDRRSARSSGQKRRI